MEQRRRDKRQLFLATAVRLFGQHGYATTTVPMVVAAANASTGSFYSYFKNKEDVFAAALADLGERIAAEINQAVAGHAAPLAQMRAAVERLFLFLAEHPDEARILIVETSGLGGRLEEIRRGIIESHARSVQEMMSRHALSPQPEVAAQCWVGAVYQAAWWWLGGDPARRLPATEMARAVAVYNLRAIGADFSKL